MTRVVPGSAEPSIGPLPALDSDAWLPRPADLRRSRLLAFCRRMGCSDRAVLDAESRRDPAAFWSAAAAWLELEWGRSPDATMAGADDPAAVAWFPGGQLNLADNAVHRWVRRGRGSEPALVAEDEAGARSRLTFAELADEVDAVASGLLGLGLEPGDRVGIQLPMVQEAAVALLACAQAGLVAVPLFSGFGAGAAGDRLRLAGARAHIVAESVLRRGRQISMRRLRSELRARVPTLEVVVVVPSGGGGNRLAGGEVSWNRLREARGSRVTTTVEARHPLMIMFTSGTTGAPKGAVLTHAGFALKAGTDAAWCFDLGPGDVASWVTDPGWIMGPITVLGALIAGSAVALYAGAPDHPDPARLWRVADRNAITMLGVSPTLVRSLMAHGAAALPDRIGALRVLASSGEPLTRDAYMWLFERVAERRLPIINYSGGTEVSGAIVANFTAEPIRPSGFAGPAPGMAADVAGPDGRSLVGTGGVGELVLRAPSPGMSDGLWGDDRDRYRATYWSRWPGVWLHGDWAEVDRDGVWYIRGRSDDTLKVAGKRLGPAEVEAAVNEHGDILESAAIGVPDDLKGEVVIVFARPRHDAPDIERLRSEIMALVAERLGKALRPKAVLLVADLPRTRSGKLLRRVARAAHLGQPLGDLGTLEDVAAIDAVRAAR